ncbi:small RNA-binding protein 11, chloroplastic-like [Actinidia eriantha]|uniref:small RNA-binding protein 11, chloroplastic-like n=1 Tax=Actinidia eriantha TaxID=165200 RepID=UPI0025878B9C|nr:small RNA-binding protein 11, chloroplastic-like [Actinidia eriantha]
MEALSKTSRHLFHSLSQSSRSSVPSSSFQPSLSHFISRRGLVSKLFVGGLSFNTTEKGLLDTFSKYGQVIEAKVVSDRVSDRSKGFGFVTFASVDEAEKAKTEMDGKALNGRVIFVDYAKPRTDFGGGMPIARGPPDPTTDH